MRSLKVQAVFFLGYYMNKLSLEKTYTVKELCKSLEVPKRTMIDTVNRLFPGKAEHGKTTFLNEAEVTDISKELKRAHNIYSASIRTVATTDMELLDRSRDLIFDLTSRVKQLSDELEESRPKVSFYDQVTGSKDAIDIGSAAKVLNMGIGRNKLFSFLRENKILQENNQPYQRFIDAGYFRTIEQKFSKPDGSTNISIKTVVYQKGLDYIKKQLESK